jgi:dihydroorotate dehydrogenase (fumarate)
VGTLLEGLLNFMERHHLKSIRDLRTCRPLAFDSDEERIDYIKAVSAKTQPAMVRDSNCMIESDRWGHPRSPR